MRRKVILTVLSMLLLTACSNSRIVYDYSADVDPEGWAPADTLFYPIRVEEQPQPGLPIDRQQFYMFTVTVRYERMYPCRSLPVHLLLDNGQTGHRVTFSLADESGLPDGNHWATLYTKQFDITGWSVHLDEAGDYVLKIWPDSLYAGITSLTVTLKN